MLKTILKPFASLRLTVVLIVLAMLLIYAGTWAQIDTGIWQVQKKFFHSLFVWVDFATFLPRSGPNGWKLRGGFPMPGGYLLGLMLLINLLSAHFLRFKMTWKRSGIILIHLGLILLLVGEGITSTQAVESQMSIDEGSYAKFSSDIREVELATVDPSSPDHDQVFAIPQSMLQTGAEFSQAPLPVKVKIDRYFSNSDILGPMQPGDRSGPKANAGLNVGITAVNAPSQGGVDSQQDFPAAYVTLTSRDGGATAGTFLVSAMPEELPTGVAGQFRLLNEVQEAAVDGKTYLISLRFKRIYKPYTVSLLKFTHGKYLGTNEDKDFASHIRLVDPSRNVDREVKIWMNNPLRYHGETFYQSGFKQGDKSTVLQVVSNPGWLMPYFACAIGALGMVIHFGMNLFNFAGKRRRSDTALPATSNPSNASKPKAKRAPAPPAMSGAMAMVSVTAALFVLLAWGCGLGYIFQSVDANYAYDMRAFATLPVSYEGRTQPLDSLARNALRLIAGRDNFTVEGGGSVSAIHWLTDVFFDQKKAADYQIFRVDNTEVKGLLNLDDSRKRFSFKEIIANPTELQTQLDKIAKDRKLKKDKDWDTFQRKLAELGDKLTLYIDLGQIENLYLLAPVAAGEQWRPLADGLNDKGATHPAAQAYVDMLKSYKEDDAGGFNKTVASYASLVDSKIPATTTKARFETTFNRFDPFTQCIALYIAAFILACLSWLGFGPALRRAAMFAILLALVIHTIGLVSRIYISGRPPVTNLASSAIFIAWGIILMSVGLEWFYRNGIGAACAGLLGFLSLCIADRLALDGDTFKVLVAVLDTNYWLATHVVMITLGYAATFLAGFIGIVYIVGGLFTRGLNRESGKELVRMIYGIVCFAMLFSFVGTILGGIWADQSWGRFWGWDPKENGAVLIVLSNALLLHARWGGLVKDRGIACLAIFGNIVTAWSWFGVNMLGVGLHSYGFMESALMWLLIFVASQLVLIAVANVPLAWWRSYRVLTAGAASGREKIPAVVPA